MTINNNLKNWRNKQMNEQMQLFKNPFDDVHVGSAYINQDKTEIYIVTSMFSQYLSGLMIIRRVLNDPNKFTECCYLVKQTARMTYYDAIKEIQQGLVSIDNVDGCHYLQIIGDDKHGYEAIWQNPRCKCELGTFDTYQEAVHAIKKYYRYEHVKRVEL